MASKSLIALSRRAIPLLLGIFPVISQAQVFGPPAALPDKDVWRLVGGQEFNGIPTGFGYRMLLIQRRFGFIYINGEKITRLSSNPILEIVGQANGIDSIQDLMSYLAKQPNAQGYLPYCTLQYGTGNRVNEEVPLVMLDATELTLLKPAYDAWYAAAKREYEERLFRAQQLANQQAMLQMQQQQLMVQRSMAQSSWMTALATEEGAYQMKRQADEMKRLNDKLQ